MPNLEFYISRFSKKTKFTSDHWLWQGATNKKTRHGLVTVDGRTVYLHWFIFCLKNNIDYKSEILVCHKRECNIPFCWNPDHLYAGNASTNTLDIVDLGYHKEANKTHCPKGHLYSHRSKNGKRVCIICKREYDKIRNKTIHRIEYRKRHR